MRLIKILPFLLLLISCTELYKKNAQVSSFNCSKEPYNGIEYGKDSTIFFFPKEIFNDTTWYAKYKDSIIEYTRSYPLEQVIDFYNLNKNFVIKLDSISINKNKQNSLYEPIVLSYSLFKMREPILSECYLHREIYRLIINRSYNPFTIIEINKSNDSIWIETKMLDRVVLGPFLPPIEFLVSDSSDFKKFLVEHPKEIRKNDSMNKIIRNTNYFVAYKVHKTISDSTWAVFSNLLLKSKFWQRQSFFYNERISLDGDVWVLEGHIKSGYKLIEMNIPYCNIPYKFESNDKTLLRYFLKLAGLDEKKYKIY